MLFIIYIFKINKLFRIIYNKMSMLNKNLILLLNDKIILNYIKNKSYA